MGLVICQGCSAEYAAWTGACPKCGGTQVIRVSEQQDRMIDRIVAGRYRILRKLGQGGMGSVYMGELVGIGQRVALKFLNSNLSLDPDVARRFLNEAKSYARVAHPNAVILHDFGQDEEGNLFISMELVEGSDLKKLLSEQGRLPVAEAVEIILQVADVLAQAHAKGVIHRDLKPENIMVRRGTRGLFVKVLDFGIARMVGEGATRLTVQGAIAGTPRYMAPEQAEGRDIDGRADVYSLGMVLLELLTGVHPFDGPTVAEILRKQIATATPHIQELAPDLSLPAIDAVIQKATAKRREDRYATMDEFAASLGNAVPLHLAKTETPLARSQADTQQTVDQTLIRTQPDSTGLVISAANRSASDAAKRSSSRPLWAGGAALVLLIAGGSYFAFGRQSKQPPGAQVKAAVTRTVVTKPIAAVDTEPTTAVDTKPNTAADTKPASAIEQKPAKQEVPADLKLREQALWHETYVRANNEFLVGRLTIAKDMLATIPKEHVDQDVSKLLGSLEEITTKLARARSLSSRGECSSAIKIYDEILRAYPSNKPAQDERRACQRMLTPQTLE